MAKIISISMNPSIDKSSSVGHVIAERKLYCTNPRYEPGGGGVNVSRAIKKLGGQSKLFYPAGGLSGQLLNDLLEEEKIAHQPILTKGTVRENLIVLEEFTGYQFRFGMPGPRLYEDEWKKFLDEIVHINPKPEYIVASGSLPEGVPQDFYVRVARIGKEINAKVIVDSSGQPLRLALKEGVFLIKPNIREFRESIEGSAGQESQIKAIAEKIVERGESEVVVISLGSAGAILSCKETTEHIVPPTVPIISKVGAGDSMVAGIVLSLARGMPIRQAVRFGVAAGAAAVMTAGTELCHRQDAERLYEEMVPGVSA